MLQFGLYKNMVTAPPEKVEIHFWLPEGEQNSITALNDLGKLTGPHNGHIARNGSLTEPYLKNRDGTYSVVVTDNADFRKLPGRIVAINKILEEHGCRRVEALDTHWLHKQVKASLFSLTALTGCLE